MRGNFSRRKILTVVRDYFYFCCEVQKSEDLREQLNPGKDQRGFGNYLAACPLIDGYRRFRGDITRSDIFREE